MKLKNKKTGEIHEIIEVVPLNDMDKKFVIYSQTDAHNYTYKNLAELNEEWEDYEEPKGWWYIDCNGEVFRGENADKEHTEEHKSIGNYYTSSKEAEKAVEKLKAIQRLKNYYLKFKLDFVKNKIDFTCRLDGTLHSSVDEQRNIFEDMNLLFGGEE